MDVAKPHFFGISKVGNIDNVITQPEFIDDKNGWSNHPPARSILVGTCLIEELDLCGNLKIGVLFKILIDNERVQIC